MSTSEASQAGSRQLSEAAILDAAKELSREVGVERLTMRALADALGVSAMATYHYVKGRDSLLLLMVDSVMGEVDVPPRSDGQPWEERLWLYMQAMRYALAVYPGITDFLLHHVVTDAARRYMENCINILEEDGGFTHESARNAFAIIYTFMWGGSVFLGVQTRQRANGTRKARRGSVPTTADLASVEHARAGYDTIITGLKVTTGLA
jgi:AcrR family transcriptional regulator